jgi:anaerobic ribonucleoside-triphosphate reductase activating protein
VIDIRYASVRSLDISNGEGVGIALFVQGCHEPHCKNCFNPETWDFNGGKEWTGETKNKFLELADRPYIRRVSILGGEPLAKENLNEVLDLVTEIKKRYNKKQDMVYDTQDKHNILNKNPDKIRLLYGDTKTIWLYTGYSWSDIFDLDHMKKDEEEFLICNKRAEIVSKCDVLVDGRYVNSLRDPSLKWCGSSNQRIINVQESLKQGKVICID